MNAIEGFFELTIWERLYIIFTTNIIRYFLMAGLPFFIFYIWKKRQKQGSKIQPKFQKNADYQREILYSILTFGVFGLVGVLIYHPLVSPYTLLYRDWSKYGTTYGVLSFFLLILLHDTYFYWTHRAMHHPKLFKTFHLLHHKSTNPSPWAAFAFQPTEAFVEAGILILAPFVMPLHGYVIVAFLFFMTIYNVYGHLGWELYPPHFNRHFLLRWLNTSINHNQHHQYFKGNYGLYFRWWDEWMGTTRTDYDATFENLKR
jgi:sterol desaturase/sphingolipid hydroxylase (fatty acid hydroxylase superfamily)